MEKTRQQRVRELLAEGQEHTPLVEEVAAETEKQVLVVRIFELVEPRVHPLETLRQLVVKRRILTQVAWQNVQLKRQLEGKFPCSNCGRYHD